MAKGDRIVLGVLTPEDLERSAPAERFLRLLVSEFPDFSPEFHGNLEPVRVPFTTVEECISKWSVPFLWRRKRPAVEGAIWPGSGTTAIYVGAGVRGWESDRLEAFARSMCELLHPDFAYVHLMTEAERDREPYDLWYPIDIGITPHDLKKGIPNLCWLTVFGPPFVERVRAAASLLTDGALPAADANSERIVVRVTPTVEGVREYSSFQAQRSAIKTILDPGGTLFLRAP
jgi:hypothetical protein